MIDYVFMGYNASAGGHHPAQGWNDLLTHVTTREGTKSIVYDNAGNPVNYMGNTLTWTNGRLLAGFNSSVTGGVAFRYDYNGMRLQKRVIGGTTTNYFVQGSRVLGERRIGGGFNDFIWYYYDESGVVGMNFRGGD